MGTRGFLLRFTSTGILALLIVLTFTGLYASVWVSPGIMMDIHRIAAWALIAMIPAKAVISWRSLKRGFSPRFDRSVMLGVSLLMAVLGIAILILGLLWTWRIGPEMIKTPVFWQTVLGWHWILALVFLAPVALHVWRRWPRPKAQEFTSRRGVMRMAGIGAVGIAGWWLAAALAEKRQLPEHPRLITGSRRDGQFSGNQFPITSEAKPAIDLATWRLTITGAVAAPFTLTYDDLLALPRSEWVATLDCTNGWWTTQAWQGVRLADLLQEAGMQPNALAVRMTSATKYLQWFSLAEAQQILIATHVGGEPLTDWHGFPARGVAPFRRGWFWVKWLTDVKVLDNVGQIVAHPGSIR